MPFFIALCLFWRLDPFGIHLLTLKCLCWQELGSLWCGAGELRRGRQWRQTEQCVCACVYSKGFLLVVMHMHSAHLSNAWTRCDGQRGHGNLHKLNLCLLSIKIREIIKEKMGTVVFTAIMTRCFRRLKINGAQQLTERQYLEMYSVQMTFLFQPLKQKVKVSP